VKTLNEALTTEHLKALRAYAFTLTRNEVDAEDVVQDTLERALRFWPAFKQTEQMMSLTSTATTSVLGWLRIMMYRLVCNSYHRAQVGKRKATEAATFNEPGDLRDDVARATERDEARRQVAEGLKELPPAWREVLERADLHEQSYASIAEAMGTPIGTVMSRLHRARRLLKESIGTHEAVAQTTIQVVDLTDEAPRPQMAVDTVNRCA
jgi:RNA polymerase sigma-70 factor (ECF subfamily)